VRARRAMMKERVSWMRARSVHTHEARGQETVCKPQHVPFRASRCRRPRGIRRTETARSQRCASNLASSISQPSLADRAAQCCASACCTETVSTSLLQM
jgi:hypothetical protein